jgi:hypothetical protein
MAKKSLEIDMIAGSQLRDTQGEMLSVEGADISDLEAGKGRFNDNHGKGFFNSIGTVTGAKKIFKKEDCENDRHKYYWEKVKAPFIYVKGYLHDDEDHPNAKAAAAILRNIHKNDSPLQLKASVEGGVIARGISDSTLLARTKIHSVALTFTPANNNTLVEPTSLDKSAVSTKEDLRLIKSVMHLAQSNVPSFRHIVRDASAEKIIENIGKIQSLSKKLQLKTEVPSLTKQEIINKAIEEKVESNVKAIHAIIVGEDLDKAIPKSLVPAMMGAATAFGSPAEAAKMPSSNIVAASPSTSSQLAVEPKKEMTISRNNDPRPHIEKYKEIAKKYPVLGAIGMVESTGGLRHDDHVTIKKSGHADSGHTAGGIWAMMPRQASFILSTDKELAKKYPNLLKASKDLENRHLEFTNTFNKNPQAAADFAVSAYLRLEKKIPDEDTRIASWIKGVTGAYRYLKEYLNFDKHEYTQKVKKQLAQIRAQDQEAQRSLASPQSIIAPSPRPTPLPGPTPAQVVNPEQVKIRGNGTPLLLSLTAGYGGASAPMSRVGGSVLQSESLSNGFKYIVCDKCGKEQVHSKYQVKCRHCNDNFSLEKLNSILS